MMIFTSMLFLLTTSLVAVDASCLYCVSPLITMNARKFPINFDRTAISDVKCARNLTKVHQPAGCNGACLTMNLTREGESEPAGVLRDCLDSHKKIKRILEEKREADSLHSLAGVCHSESVHMRGTTYTATYCACVGQYCNNEGTRLAAIMQGEARAVGAGDRRRGSRLSSSPNGAAAGVHSLALAALLIARRL